MWDWPIGQADALPKLIAYRLLQPALAMATPTRLVCHEDKSERLLTESIVERFYAVSVERKLKHPAVVAISEAARSDLFAPQLPASGGVMMD